MQLRRISGIGDRKLDLYGEAFLDVISEALSEDKAKEVDYQKEEVLQLYRIGMSVEQISAKVHLSPQQLMNILAEWIGAGAISLTEVVELPLTEISQIEQEIITSAAVNGASLKPVFDHFAGAYSLGVLRCVQAAMQ
jgi:ATP-dependent DNA helicase RecQ